MAQELVERSIYGRGDGEEGTHNVLASVLTKCDDVVVALGLVLQVSVGGGVVLSTTAPAQPP
jgi:hypothetical protein